MHFRPDPTKRVVVVAAAAAAAAAVVVVLVVAAAVLRPNSAQIRNESEREARRAGQPLGPNDEIIVVRSPLHSRQRSRVFLV